MELLEARRAQRYTLSEAAELLREPVERVSLELVKRWPQADPQLVTGAQLEAWKGLRWFLYACFSLAELAGLSRAGYRPPELFEAAYAKAVLASLRNEALEELDFGLSPTSSLLESLEERLSGRWQKIAQQLIEARDRLRECRRFLRGGSARLDEAARWLGTLSTFLESSRGEWPAPVSEDVARCAQRVLSRLFYLRVQLETSEEELEAMGWRTDWTEADTREELLEALRELGVLVGRLRRELVRHCRVAL